MRLKISMYGQNQLKLYRSMKIPPALLFYINKKRQDKSNIFNKLRIDLQLLLELKLKYNIPIVKCLKIKRKHIMREYIYKDNLYKYYIRLRGDKRVYIPLTLVKRLRDYCELAKISNHNKIFDKTRMYYYKQLKKHFKNVNMKKIKKVLEEHNDARETNK